LFWFDFSFETPIVDFIMNLTPLNGLGHCTANHPSPTLHADTRAIRPTTYSAGDIIQPPAEMQQAFRPFLLSYIQGRIERLKAQPVLAQRDAFVGFCGVNMVIYYPHSPLLARFSANPSQIFQCAAWLKNQETQSARHSRIDRFDPPPLYR
jgi:hypothetical protein